MQVCTLLQTDNHASTSPLSFLQAGCPSCRPTNSVKALKASRDRNIHIEYLIPHWVCPSVSLCGCGPVYLSAIISLELYARTSPKCFVHVSVVVTRSSSVGAVIRYALPVLWMTSRFSTRLWWQPYCATSLRLLWRARPPCISWGNARRNRGLLSKTFESRCAELSLRLLHACISASWYIIIPLSLCITFTLYRIPCNESLVFDRTVQFFGTRSGWQFLSNSKRWKSGILTSLK